MGRKQKEKLLAFDCQSNWFVKDKVPFTAADGSIGVETRGSQAIELNGQTS